MLNVNKGIIIEMLENDKDELENKIDNTINEFKDELNNEYMVYSEIIINHENYKLEKAYNLIANENFNQDLDFSGEYKHDLFNKFIDDLNYCLDEVLENDYEDYYIGYGFGESGFGLLISKVI